MAKYLQTSWVIFTAIVSGGLHINLISGWIILIGWKKEVMRHQCMEKSERTKEEGKGKLTLNDRKILKNSFLFFFLTELILYKNPHKMKWAQQDKNTQRAPACDLYKDPVALVLSLL